MRSASTSLVISLVIAIAVSSANASPPGFLHDAIELMTYPHVCAELGTTSHEMLPFYEDHRKFQMDVCSPIIQQSVGILFSDGDLRDYYKRFQQNTAVTQEVNDAIMEVCSKQLTGAGKAKRSSNY